LYKVQTGVFEEKENAEKLAKELKQKGILTYITKE
jgi:cell division septation protein DedD